MKHSAGRIEFGGGCVLFAALVLPAFALAQAAAAPPVSTQSAATRIGYVDMKRLIDNAPQMIDALARLKSEFATRDETIKTDDAKLAALKQRYERDGAIMTKADADMLKREVDATERANKRLHDEAHNEYNARATAERDRAYQAMQDAVIEFARTQGYDLIVSSPVWYASPRIDVTDAVLQRLRQTAAPKP